MSAWEDRWLPSASRVSAVAAGMLAALGSYWAFTRGGRDFDVFHEAFRLALNGWGTEIYRATPDRYLYAPGFAFVFAPLGALAKPIALGVWCLAKALGMGMVLARLAEKLRSGFSRPMATLVSCAGALLLAKPILIDFQYGQINLFLVSIAVLCLISHFDRDPKRIVSAMLWALLAILAVTKVFLVPLLAVPWMVTRGLSRGKLRTERAGVLIGVALVVLMPFFFEGFSGGFSLYSSWRQAVIAKGVPQESHNQSFTAMLYHYLSGSPTHVISEGTEVPMGRAVLSLQAIQLLSYAWTLITLGILAGWMLTWEFRAPLRWIAVLLGLLIVPSHLVWKPYFVFSLPAAVLVLAECVRVKGKGKWKNFLRWGVPGLLFVLINLTGFDFVGRSLGPQIEASSLLLFLHLGLLTRVAIAKSE